jgi:uncharacterized protein DUF547
VNHRDTRSFCIALYLSLFALASGSAMAAPNTDAWDFWAEDNPQSTRQVDHTLWQNFLDQYLVPQADGVNRVAYNRVGLGEGHKELQTYLQNLADVDPRALTRDEQFAYWVNLYNALTVEVVLSNPDKKSIRRMGKGLFSFGPWDDTVATIAGEDVTLNDIEHRILRPIWQDPRIHFVVNCASIGCPNLQPQALRADNLEALLDTARNEYINHPRGVDTRPGTLNLSSIFDWYQSDFASDPQGLLKYLARFHQQPDALLQADPERIKFDYDWTLNSLEPR